MNILFVCSGNTCRSPLAVAAWRALQAAETESRRDETETEIATIAFSLPDNKLEEAKFEDANPNDAKLESGLVAPVRLPGAWLLERDAISAGLAAEKGARAARNAIRAALDWEQDLSIHRAHRLNRALAREASLICTMTLEQSRAVCAHFGTSVERVRPLNEFAAWCDDSQSGARGLEEERLAALLGMAPRPIDGSDDIVDPYGGSIEAYRCCAAQIYRAVAGLRVALRRGEAHLR